MSSNLTKNTLYLTIASVGQKLVAFVYFLFVARMLQPEKTGMYFLAVSVAMVFSSIADAGITPVVIRELAKTPENITQIMRRALALKIPFLFIGYVCTLITAYLLGYQTEVIVLTAISGLSLLLDSIHLLFYGLLRSQQQLHYEAIGLCLGQVLVAVVGGCVLIFFPSIGLLLGALVLGSLLNVLLSARVVYKLFGKQLFFPVWDFPFAKSFFRMAIPFALAAIFVKVYSYIDTILLSKFLDTTVVGLYSIAYKFTYAFQFLPLAFVAALYPKMSWSLVHDRDGLPDLFRRSLWYMALLVTPLVLGIWLIAKQAVLLVGQSYADAAPILSVLVFALIPIFLDFPVGSLLNASGKQATKTAIMGCTMIINIIANIFFIPRFEALGAAYSALISFSFMFVAGFFFVQRIIPNFEFRQWGIDMLKIGLSGSVMIMIGRLLLPVLGWIAVIPTCGLIYLVTLLMTGVLKKEDLHILRSLRRL